MCRNSKAESLQEMPLARASVGAALPLDRGVNPAYQQQMEDFVRKTLRPLQVTRYLCAEMSFDLMHLTSL